MTQRIPPTPKKLSAPKQRRLDALLEKNAEGTITPSEKPRLDDPVSEAERLMVANAKRLAELSQSERPHPPLGADPVTVWVSPEHVEP